MKPVRLKLDLFRERASGINVFEIPGKKVSYAGILERIAVDSAYVPKLHVHERSSWLIIGIRPWLDRYTLYYGNCRKTEEEAREFLAGLRHRILLSRPLDQVICNNFQDAFVYWE